MAKIRGTPEKKNKGKFSANYVYTVDKVFDSTTSGTTSNYGSATSVDANWTVKTNKYGEKFVQSKPLDIDASFKGFEEAIDSAKIMFCKNCGNPCEKEKALDGEFCGAECKYKYCEIENEADENSE